VFEGVDAGGKGGAIRRITSAIDARLYRGISVAAPTDEEKAHHYLWRFWRHIPRAGYMCFYDRSWYGRVLVERVEGFAPVKAYFTKGYTATSGVNVREAGSVELVRQDGYGYDETHHVVCNSRTQNDARFSRRQGLEVTEYSRGDADTCRRHGCTEE
jgi:hypothetical protein